MQHAVIEQALSAALEHHRAGRLVEAERAYRSVLAAAPATAQAHLSLGALCFAQRRFADAIASFSNALRCEPSGVDAKINLALALQSNGQVVEAVRMLFDWVTREAENFELRRALVQSLYAAPLASVDVRNHAVLISLCKDDRISMHHLMPAVVTHLKAEESFSSPGSGWTRSELMLASLPRMILQDAEIERKLTALRRTLLFGESGIAAFHEFRCALARNCFLTGYAFFVAPDEEQKVAALTDMVGRALSAAGVPLRALEDQLLLVSLYRPLSRLSGWERLLHPAHDWSPAFGEVIRQQVVNRRREIDLASRVPSLSAIDEDSLAVQAQYEDCPYPPWITATVPDKETFEDVVRRIVPGEPAPVYPHPIAILVAGCGTGHHPIATARTYRDCEVLAVDLSRTSLAYAARMAEQLGVTNISFAQADILELGRLDRRFALIECAGVLHHIRDSIGAWRVLAGLLQPGGLMGIALYSERARRFVTAARKFARANFDATPAGIRACRLAIMALPPEDPARRALVFADFFSLDGCRDLILHEHEQTFTLPLLAEYLSKLELQFLGFNLEAAVLARFTEMFPHQGARLNLVFWEQFEAVYPDTFARMYSFWCRRRLA